MTANHICPAGPDRPRDAFDCVPCRTVMLESFMSTVPEPLDHLDLSSYFRYRNTGWVKPSHVPVWGASGGVWRAVCSCGWRRDGTYRPGQDRFGQGVALGHSEHHQKHPEEQ